VLDQTAINLGGNVVVMCGDDPYTTNDPQVCDVSTNNFAALAQQAVVAAYSPTATQTTISTSDVIIQRITGNENATTVGSVSNSVTVSYRVQNLTVSDL